MVLTYLGVGPYLESRAPAHGKGGSSFLAGWVATDDMTVSRAGWLALEGGLHASADFSFAGHCHDT